MRIKIEDVFNVLKKELDIFTFNELTNHWKLDKIKQEGFITNISYDNYPFAYFRLLKTILSKNRWQKFGG